MRRWEQQHNIKWILKRRQWQPAPVLLPGNSHGRRRLLDCSPWGHEESDTTERLHFHFSPSCIGEDNGNPLQCSCLENPRDGGAWWAAVYGIAQSRTWLKRLSSSSKGNQPWIFTERTEADGPILWLPDVKSWLTGKDPDAGKDWGQKEKGATEDEIAGWHHRLNGLEFKQTPGNSERQGSLMCCSPRSSTENQTWLRNWTTLVGPEGEGDLLLEVVLDCVKFL